MQRLETSKPSMFQPRSQSRTLSSFKTILIILITLQLQLSLISIRHGFKKPQIQLPCWNTHYVTWSSKISSSHKYILLQDITPNLHCTKDEVRRCGCLQTDHIISKQWPRVSPSRLQILMSKKVRLRSPPLHLQGYVQAERAFVCM